MSKKTPVKSSNSRASIAGAEVIVSEKDAAAFAGKSTRTVRRWRKEGMLMATLNGKPVFLRSQLRLFASNEGRQPTKTKMKKDEASASLTQIRDERERWAFEQEKGEWIRKDETERNNLQKIMTVKRALLGQGRKLAMQLAAITDPRKIQALLDKENRNIVEGFSR